MTHDTERKPNVNTGPHHLDGRLANLRKPDDDTYLHPAFIWAAIGVIAFVTGVML